jgi:hypothetical protein
MGLLEDAIREHLELKRLRGADPAEVAREQQEALEAPPGAAATPGAANDAAGVPYEPEDTAGAAHEDAPAPQESPDPAGSPTDGGLARVGDETAELDMEEVLAYESSAAGGPTAPPELADERTPAQDGAAPADHGAAPADHSAEEDSLEWEVPARSHDADPVSGPREEVAGEHAAPREQERRHGEAEDLEARHERAEENAPGQGRLSF